MFETFRWTEQCDLAVLLRLSVSELSQQLDDRVVADSWFAHRGAVWVLVRAPLSNLDYIGVEHPLAIPQRIETARGYAARGGEFPPGIATYRGWPHNVSGKAYVWDGNHRTLAAYFRGDCAIRMWMPEQDFERLKRDAS